MNTSVQQLEQRPVQKTIQCSINENLNKVDRYLEIGSFTDKTLVEWFEPLVSSISSNGSVPYLLDIHERYRASPLASTIIWMDKAGLLPESTIESMQSRLLFLRDNNEPNDRRPGRTSKFPEDNEGWSLAEGVSVWSTSLAILSMIDSYQVGLKRANEFKASALWLAKQKQTGENGWGYQCHRNCNQSIIMTSLATRAIALVLKNKDAFAFSDNEIETLKQAAHSGFTYIRDEMQEKEYEVYWRFNNNKSCVATVWALLALKSLREISINHEINGFYSSVIKKGRRYIINSIPKKSIRWKDEPLVCEAGAKYDSMKNYYSFSATLLMDVFDLGVSAYNIRIINQIRWLLKNSSNWKIEQYDTKSMCTFTYAMVLSTIAKWVSLVGKENAQRLINAPQSKLNQVVELFIGYPVLEETSIQVIDKNRVVFVFVILLLVLILCKIRGFIAGVILSFITKYVLNNSNTVDTVVINIVSNAIYAILSIIFVTFVSKITNCITRRFMQ